MILMVNLIFSQMKKKFSKILWLISRKMEQMLNLLKMEHLECLLQEMLCQLIGLLHKVIQLLQPWMLVMMVKLMLLPLKFNKLTKQIQLLQMLLL